MDALTTDYDDNTFDLVTSTMLIHELPPAEIDQLFAEATRVLAPGGRMAHLDFHHVPNAFARFIHDGHARRNNEPFMSLSRHRSRRTNGRQRAHQYSNYSISRSRRRRSSKQPLLAFSVDDCLWRKAPAYPEIGGAQTTRLVISRPIHQAAAP